MNRQIINSIIRFKDETILWQSARMNYVGEGTSKTICWHHLWSFLQRLEPENRDILGYYIKYQVFDKELSAIEEVKCYYARKMSNCSEKKFSELESSVGYEMLPWSEEYVLQVSEELE